MRPPTYATSSYDRSPAAVFVAAGFRVESLDRTGAGDAFAAGFRHGLLAERPLDECARFANAAGALATRAIGAFEGVGDLAETERLAGLA